MHVHVAWPTMTFELEMVMLDVRHAVTHFSFACRNLSLPQDPGLALDPDAPGNEIEIWIDHQLGTDRTGAQFRSREIQVIRFSSL